MGWAPKGSVPGMMDPRVAQAIMANLCGAGSVREVQAFMGVKSPNTAHNALKKAHKVGLVHLGGQGSLRGPAVRIVENWGVRAGS